MFLKRAYTDWYMKKNVTILIGLVVLFAVLYGGSLLMNKGGKDVANVKDVETSVAMKSFIGQVVRNYEGENVLEYGFDIPETATTSIDMDGALIKIVDQELPVATVYMSYEGGRGYSALDYISNVIAPHVSVINVTGTSSVGMYDWQIAESEGSEWYVTPVASSSWLIVVENKKSVHSTVEKMLESVFAK